LGRALLPQRRRQRYYLSNETLCVFAGLDICANEAVRKLWEDPNFSWWIVHTQPTETAGWLGFPKSHQRRGCVKSVRPIPSCFSRWSFSFCLTTRLANRDTIGLQPMEFQFQPNTASTPRWQDCGSFPWEWLKLKRHRVNHDGAWRTIIRSKLNLHRLKHDGIPNCKSSVRLKLNLHRLKHDGIPNRQSSVRLKLNLHRLKRDGIGHLCYTVSALVGFGSENVQTPVALLTEGHCGRCSTFLRGQAPVV